MVGVTSYIDYSTRRSTRQFPRAGDAFLTRSIGILDNREEMRSGIPHQLAHDTIWRIEAAMASQRPGYQAYLLRLWQVRNGQEARWHASLDDAHTGERRAFGDLEALFEFLRARTESTSDATAEDAENTKRSLR